MPLYPGTLPLSIERHDSMEKGAESNSSSIIMNTHSGTHLDMPPNFLKNGLLVDELLEKEMVLEPAYLLPIPKRQDEEILINDIKGIEEMDDAEALLLRAGFFSYRKEMKEVYISKHPWISPYVPDHLRKMMPRLQLFGIDTLSIAVPHRPREGRNAHLGFLKGKRPIMILEDLDLSNESLLKGRWRLRIYPWIIDEIEAVPATVLAQRI